MSSRRSKPDPAKEALRQKFEQMKCQLRDGNNNRNNLASLKECGQHDDSYACDSMDCLNDDCFGLVLARLPLSDRIRLETVSKKWQRTAFLSVKKLVVDKETSEGPTGVLEAPAFEQLDMLCYDSDDSIGDGEDLSEDVELTRGDKKKPAIKHQALKSVLSKCRFIEMLKLGHVEVTGQTWDMIGELCPRLKKIVIKQCRYDDDEAHDFFVRYGHRLHSFNLTKGITASDLEALAKANSYYFITDLREIDDVITWSVTRDYEDFTDLELLIKRFAKSLIKINVDFINDNDTLLELISKCKNLESLAFICGTREATNKFIRIAKNAKRLRSLQMDFVINDRNNQQIPTLMKQSFTGLKKLEIRFVKYEAFDTSHQSIDPESSFDEGENLRLYENDFSGLDKTFPNVRRLIITLPHEAVLKQVLLSAAKMKHLVYFKVIISEEWDNGDDLVAAFNQLIKGSKTLRVVKMNVLFLPLDELVALAKKTPKVDIFFHKKDGLTDDQLKSLADNLHFDEELSFSF